MPQRGATGLALALAVALAAGACGGDAGTATGGPRAATGPPRTAASPTVYEGTFTVMETPPRGPELCTFVLDSLPPQCHGLPVVGWDWDAVDGEESAGAVRWGEWHVTGTYDGERFTLSAPPRVPDPPSPRGTPDFSPACDRPTATVAGDGRALYFAATGNGQEFDVPDLVHLFVSEPSPEWGDRFVLSVVVRPGATAAATDYIRARYGGPLCVVERDGPTEAELQATAAEVGDADARAHLGPDVSGGPDPARGVVSVAVWVADEAALAYARARWHGLVELHGHLTPVAG
jgi:hypothetical protein